MRRRTGDFLPGGTAPPDPPIARHGAGSSACPCARTAIIALAAAFAIPPLAAAAERPRAEASVDRTVIAADEAITLRVRVEGGDEAAVELGPRLPFDVLSRSSAREASVSLGGGAGVRIRQVMVFTYRLAPRRAGELVVPPAIATVGGARAETAPIRVRVVPRGAPLPAAPGNRSWRGWERDLALEVEVDRRSPFLGEQVTASIWLISPVGVVAYEGFKPPAYDGFWAEDLETPQRLEFRVRHRAGVPVRAYLVQRLALFPTRAGALELGPYELDVAARVGDGGPLGLLADVRRAHRRSAPVRLDVKPLPPGAPPGFQTVNVGRFAITATAGAQATAGEPAAVTLSVEGEGNLRALALPPLPDVPGARRFEPTTTDAVAPRGGRLAGARAVETVLVPETAGELVVPPVAWSWFDPRAGRYETARTDELRIAVRAGAAPGPAEPAADPLARLRVPPLADALRRRTPPPYARAPYLALLAAAPLAFAAAALADGVRARRARGAVGARGGDGLRAAGRRLAELRAGRLGDAALARGVERALSAHAEARLGHPVGALTRAALAAALAEAGAPRPGIDALVRTLDACDEALFGGGGDRDALLALAERAVAALAAEEEAT